MYTMNEFVLRHTNITFNYQYYRWIVDTPSSIHVTIETTMQLSQPHLHKTVRGRLEKCLLLVRIEPIRFLAGDMTT